MRSCVATEAALHDFVAEWRSLFVSTLNPIALPAGWSTGHRRVVPAAGVADDTLAAAGVAEGTLAAEGVADGTLAGPEAEGTLAVLEVDGVITEPEMHGVVSEREGSLAPSIAPSSPSASSSTMMAAEVGGIMLPTAPSPHARPTPNEDGTLLPTAPSPTASSAATLDEDAIISTAPPPPPSLPAGYGWSTPVRRLVPAEALGEAGGSVTRLAWAPE